MFSAAGVTGSCMCRAADCNRRCTTRGSGHGEPRGSGWRTGRSNTALCSVLAQMSKMLFKKSIKKKELITNSVATLI